MAIWNICVTAMGNILLPFGNYVSDIFPPFWYILNKEKSGNPGGRLNEAPSFVGAPFAARNSSVQSHSITLVR
jgi:hypothetical protein